jgi:excisionase family DNA binding protein
MSPAETLTALVQQTPPSDLPALAGELARTLALVVARTATTAMTVVTAVAAPSTASDPASDELLTVEEAAARLNVKVSWLYRHARELPFARKIGRRTLRFDPRGLDRWLRVRAAAGN